MKGLIVVGYQGVGKSSCSGKNNCIDLESSNFYIGEERHEDWYITYCTIAINLAAQGYTVFTSSHECVVNYFRSVPLPPGVGKVVIFCPTLKMRNEWIDRLSNRYNRTDLFKDYKAYRNADAGYGEQITKLVHSGLPVYHPANIDYDLNVYVNKMRNDWCK